MMCQMQVQGTKFFNKKQPFIQAYKEQRAL